MINKRNISQFIGKHITMLLLLTLCCLQAKAQTLPFRLQDGAGTFRLGIAVGEESVWLDECQVEKTGARTYIVKSKLLGIGIVKLIICPLTETKGVVVEVSGSRLPQNLSLCWAFGACNGSIPAASAASILPKACADNVFSDEENAFTVYYGESMALRTTQGIAPIGTKLRLADAHKQSTPLALHQSGKKTDAPVISSLYQWNTEEKCYFCFYKQRAVADYNYYMLPALFEKENNR